MTVTASRPLARLHPARLSPVSLAQHVDPVYRRWRWIELLNRYLLEVAAGRIRRLIVNVPPQHGKSELISKYFPAWWVGNWPDQKVLLASYGEQFAAGWGRQARDVLEEHGPTVFEVSVDARSAAADRWNIARRRGYMATAGVGGALTGKGAHLLVIDDPVKSAKEALSETYRNAAWDWYQAVARTRVQPGGAIIVLQTRWHDDDLTGRLLRRGGDDWHQLVLPAIAKHDEALGDDVGFPWRRKAGEPLEPERYSLAELLALADPETGLDPRWWQALYQGSPRPETGDIFDRRWFRYWTTTGSAHGLTYLLPRPDGTEKRVVTQALRRFLTVDLAVSEKTSADWTVISAWGVVPSTSALLLLDRVRGRMQGPDLAPVIRASFDRNSPAWIGVESTAFQLSVVQDLRRKGLPVRELHPDTDKISRAIFAAARVEGGGVYFPAGAPWLTEWENELVAFPTGDHDDQVDTLSYAVAAVARSADSVLRVE